MRLRFLRRVRGLQLRSLYIYLSVPSSKKHNIFATPSVVCDRARVTFVCVSVPACARSLSIPRLSVIPMCGGRQTVVTYMRLLCVPCRFMHTMFCGPSYLPHWSIARVWSAPFRVRPFDILFFPHRFPDCASGMLTQQTYYLCAYRSCRALIISIIGTQVQVVPCPRRQLLLRTMQ